MQKIFSFNKHHCFKNLFRSASFIVTIVGLLAVGLPQFSSGQDKKLWLVGGQNLNNTRNAESEKKITPQNAHNLAVKWAFTTQGDVSATPTVDESGVYFPDWKGNLYKVNPQTGAAMWSHNLSFYTGINGHFARMSPAIAGNRLVIGTQLNFGYPATFNGAHVIAINKNTGALLWKTTVESFPFAIITQSPVVDGNFVYVGVASLEEGVAADPNYPCCSFRGSMVCLNLTTGSIVWKTYMTPGGKGFSGCSVWGSSPVVDKKRNTVYVTTGNNYKVPQAVLDCAGSGGTAAQIRACVMTIDGSAQNYFDAFVALDATTGAVKWANSVIPFDAWTVACFYGGPNCPDNAGPDYDFGQGPALFQVGKGNQKRDLLGAGQKSGIYWALNPDNGAIVWQNQVGPGSTLGGLQWGSAVDGDRIYTAVSNYYYIPHLMTTGPGSGNTVKGGFWAGLDAETGNRLWEVAGTKAPAVGPFPTGAIASNQGMVSVANGVVFGGAMDATGTMYAFDAVSGAKLWSFESGGSVNSGASIVDGTVYWGSGYSNFGIGTPNNKLYAFSIPENQNQHNKYLATSEAVQVGKTLVPDGNWVSVSPNPFQNSNLMLTVKGETKKQVVWYLVNAQGAVVSTGKFEAVSDNHKQDLQLGVIAPGSYMLKVESTTKRETLKLVRQ